MENETVDIERAKQWLLARTIPWNIDLDGVAKLVSTFAESECSRLASRVEELAKGLGRIVKWCDKYDWGTVPKSIEAEMRKALAGAHAEEKE